MKGQLVNEQLKELKTMVKHFTRSQLGYLPFLKRRILALTTNADEAQQNQYIHSFLVALCNLLKGNMINTKICKYLL